MKTQINTRNAINTADELKAIVNYIIWSFDVNNTTIADKYPKVIVEEAAGLWVVTINYIVDLIPGRCHDIDPRYSDDDKVIFTDNKFTLLKTESFRQLTKYVEDICEEISKVKVEM